MTDLANYIRTYENALPRTFCESVLELFESSDQCPQRNGASVRPGLSESSWLELDLSNCQLFNFRNIILNCLRHYKSQYEKDCMIRPELPVPTAFAPFIVKRYDPGGADQFQPHFDSIAEVANRYMVFLWYLNDVEQGGETEFVDLGIAIPPQMGTLLIFPPYWMYRHAGRPPVSSSKYILSTYPLW